jgi:hypothetical protein
MIDADTTPDPFALALADLRLAAALAPAEAHAQLLACAMALWDVHHRTEVELAVLKDAILSIGTFITTVTIIPFMPDGWDAAAGFPAMKGNVAFLMKDVVLLAASLYLLKQDVARAALSATEPLTSYFSHAAEAEINLPAAPSP